MDFKLEETQLDLKNLAAEILAKDEARLEEAGLLSVCVPEEAGGAGLGPVEMAVVLCEVGRRAAAVPALPVLAGTLALARLGSAEQQRRAGRPAVALREPGRALADPPLTSARQGEDGGWLLHGRKTDVLLPGPELGPALVTADAGLFLVTSPDAPGTSVSSAFTATGEPAVTLVLDGAPAERVAGPESVADVRRCFTAAVAAQASGVLAGALELTTGYIRTRRQFDRALAEFQAVTMQIADVYIAGRALDVAMWSAAWRLGEGLPAEEDLAVAAFHVSEAFRALYTCQHLHGGLGLDVTYPLHRYFAQAKHLSHLLGGADAQLDLIGALA
ncbi:acyl-CoA/acyl-ACP dehydrogenase [Nonomuraea sp. NN258]|uniref:acyl-CoA dehydrogenase family protein n=1 Tax=Nonomuraea antri TaxID=2730852 RepID=UPI0015691B67|nr:acyl-CoA dehydrogenase family protein [Nonomuraea antri]NRQ36501.1 acyl-CoA/acyl-ACP dehydrogenase [Nonomuraea antri]